LKAVDIRHDQVLKDDGWLDRVGRFDGLRGILTKVELNIGFVGELATDQLSHDCLVVHQ
jgi:hypothetical protein